MEDTEIEAKLKEVKRQLSGERDIDPARLRQAVIDDLLRDKLLGWLEENNTVVEKAPESSEAETTQEKKQPAAKAKTSTSKASTKATGTAKAKTSKAKDDGDADG